MIRKYHNHILQTDPWHREKDLQNIFNNDTSAKYKRGQISGIDKSSTTPDPGYQWKSNNLTIKHHNREPRGQSFPSR